MGRPWGGVRGRGLLEQSELSYCLAMIWTPPAEARLKEVPFFVRPIVRRKIEGLAAEAGRNEVDESFYEQAKAQFGEK